MQPYLLMLISSKLAATNMFTYLVTMELGNYLLSESRLNTTYM